MLTRTAHARNTVFYNGPATSHVPIHRQSRRLFSLLDFPTILGEGKRMVEVEMMGRRTASYSVGVGSCERFESFLTLKLLRFILHGLVTLVSNSV